MATRSDLVTWLQEALQAHGGRATIVEICKYVWDRYEGILRDSGNLFYTCQYDIRWAATILRQQGIVRAAAQSPAGTWELADGAALPNSQP